MFLHQHENIACVVAVQVAVPACRALRTVYITLAGASRLMKSDITSSGTSLMSRLRMVLPRLQTMHSSSVGIL